MIEAMETAEIAAKRAEIAKKLEAAERKLKTQEHQFAVNAKIICQWLDRIKKEIIELCHKELGR